MMNIHEWKITYDNKVVGQVLSFVRNVGSNKVLTRALDGTVYIQTIGSSLPYADITILCSREEKDIVNLAEAEGGVITAKYRGKIYIGYIEEQPEWEAQSPGEWYTTSIRLLIEEEVSSLENSTP